MTGGPQWWRQLCAWWEERHLRRQWVHQSTSSDTLRRQLALGDSPVRNQPPQPNDTLTLASADDPLSFRVPVYVEYYWTGAGQPPPAAYQLARRGLQRRAEPIAACHTLTERDRCRAELEAELCRPRAAADTDVQVWAHCVAVEADPELVEAVEQRDAAARRQLIATWQGRERQLAEQRLRELVTDPLRATAWWFTDNQDKPGQLVEMARTFQELRTVLTPSSEDGADSVGRVVDDYMTDADPARYDYLARRLNDIFKDAGRSDLVDRVHALPTGAAADPDGSGVSD